MSLRYTHLLIPKSSELVPDVTQVESFLAIVATEGAIGGVSHFVVSLPGTKPRVAKNPFTGEVHTSYPKIRHEVASPSEIAFRIQGQADYRAGVFGFGLPRRPPLPAGEIPEYHVEITCVVSPTVCSTSHLEDESQSKHERQGNRI
jgi:hypothetical protein